MSTAEQILELLREIVRAKEIKEGKQSVFCGRQVVLVFDDQEYLWTHLPIRGIERSVYYKELRGTIHRIVPLGHASRIEVKLDVEEKTIVSVPIFYVITSLREIESPQS